MNAKTLALFAVVVCIGAAVADFSYGSYGYDSYGSGGYGGYGVGMASYMPMPVPGGAGIDQSLLWLIGFLFIFMLLINNGLFNTTSSSNGTTVNFVSG